MTIKFLISIIATSFLLIAAQTKAEDFDCKAYQVTPTLKDAAYNELVAPSAEVDNDIESYSINDLNGLENYVVRLYTQNLYKIINPALRSNSLPVGYQSVTKLICATLNLQPSYVGSVYRISNLPPIILEKYSPGAIITELAFLSTSASSEGVQVYARTNNVNYNAKFEIESLNGKRVQFLSSHFDENEVLFPAGSQFRVISVTEIDGKKIINMKEVNE